MAAAKKRWYKRKRIKILLLILVILIAFRIVLPYLVLHYVNKTLAEDLDVYTGHVEDIDIALYRGAYIIKNIKIDKTDGKVPVPFFYANKIDLSVEWRQLFNGSIVAEVIVRQPMLNFVQGPTKETQQSGVEEDWRKTLKDLVPLKINRFETQQGEVHYRDFHSKPKVDVYLANVNVVVNNLPNSLKLSTTLASKLSLSAQALGYAPFDVKCDFNAFADQPEFDLNAQLAKVKLPDLNDFLKAYVKVDAEGGTFALYTEAAGVNGNFAGYVKPLLEDVKVLDLGHEDNSALETIWEGLVQALSFTFKNQRKDRVATKVKFSGSFENPKVNIFSALLSFLKNAFIKALSPTIEGTIQLDSDTQQIILTDDDHVEKAKGKEKLKKEKQEHKEK